MLTALFVLAIIELVMLVLFIATAIRYTPKSPLVALEALLIGLVSIAISIIVVIHYFMAGAA